MADNILEVRDLTKYFKTPRGMLHAVDHVNFTIERGKTLGVVGESGCGKSTTGRCVLRLLDPTSGSVIFDGQDVTKLSPKKMSQMRKDMQIIFQDPFASLDPRNSVFEIIAEPLIEHKLVKNKAELNERVMELMDTVGLAQRYANAYPHELDGGRRQRIGIARALAVEPKFIVCDEPVSALDVSIQAQILLLLKELQRTRDLTYMFITHDLSVVRHISDEIMVMYLGRCVERAPKTELFENPVHPYTKALLSAIPKPTLESRNEEAQLIKGELTSPINPAPGCAFAARCEHACDRCRQGDIPMTCVGEDHYAACVLLEK